MTEAIGGNVADAAQPTQRYDADDQPWPLRAVIMAVICAVAGFVFYHLVDDADDSRPRQALAIFVAVSTIAFVLTVELRRWWWSLAFAVGWAGVIALVGFYSLGYNRHGELFDFPFFSIIFSVLLAAPLFQAARDMGRREFPYARTHNHIWNDAVIGAASLAFTGISFLLAVLLAQLFGLVGIDFFSRLLNEGWFSVALAGAAFGTAVGVLRERDALVSIIQRLVMLVLAILAPVLAVGLVFFLVSLPFTGLQSLWDATKGTTPILLSCAAGAFILANAVIGNGKEERSTNKYLYWAATALALCILPLAIIAAVSMGLRIEQYGWTPARIWAMLVIAVAVGYGLSYLWAVVRGRMNWDDIARQWNLRGAMIVCGIAAFLALPILDFGSVSAQDQIDRLRHGRVSAEKFDWRAMAFDFGPTGRDLLKEIAAKGDLKQQAMARAALNSSDRWAVNNEEIAATYGDPLQPRVVVDGGKTVDPALIATVQKSNECPSGPCRFVVLADNLVMVIPTPVTPDPAPPSPEYRSSSSSSATVDVPPPTAPPIREQLFMKRENVWESIYNTDSLRQQNMPTGDGIAQFDSKVEVRTIESKQIYVDGKPYKSPF